MKKQIFNIVLTVFMLAVLMPVHVLAANTNDKIDVADNGTVTISSNHGAAEGISSLQFGLLVQPVEPNAEVSFEFSDGVAKIAEFRYRKDSGRLNIYLSGTEALFDESGNLIVGKVIVQDQDGKDVTATVSVAEESLKFVYGTELRTEEAEIPEQPVTINAEKPTEPDNPDDGNEDISKSEVYKELQETLKNAESYSADNYTTESYQVMKQAMEEAKAVMSSPSTTEADLEKALYNLQNAMGALVMSDNGSKPDNDKDKGEAGNTGSSNDSKSDSNTGTNSKPQTENHESNGERIENGALAHTGDDAVILPFVGLLLIAGIGLVVLFWRKRTKSDK